MLNMLHLCDWYWSMLKQSLISWCGLIIMPWLMVDGWCLPVLLKELAALYESLSSGVEAMLPTPAAYKNYIHWLSLQDIKAQKVIGSII